MAGLGRDRCCLSDLMQEMLFICSLFSVMQNLGYSYDDDDDDGNDDDDESKHPHGIWHLI